MGIKVFIHKKPILKAKRRIKVLFAKLIINRIALKRLEAKEEKQWFK